MILSRHRWANAARWLVVTLAALVVVAPPLLGNSREPVAKAGACCNQCKCCQSSEPNHAPNPAAPTRATVVKDLPAIAVLDALLVSGPDLDRSFTALRRSPVSPPHCPLFLRHCAILI